MKLTLLNKRPEVPGVTTFMFKSDEPLEWKAGQFMTYRLEDPAADDRGINRFFTNSAAPFENQVWITTRIDPDKSSTFKKDLSKLAPGDNIEARGPSGSFTIDDPDKKYVFIAGGIGITPFRSILKEFEHQNKPVNATLLYANRDENIVFKNELEEITQKNNSFKIRYFIGDQTIDDAVLNEYAKSPDRFIFYISGPEPMVESFEKKLAGIGVEDERIKRDYFPGYTAI